jgi:hypothetical protein
MERTAVDSSSIAEIGYEMGTQTLEIRFNNGGLYRYFGVPVSLHRAFVACDSKGKFFNENIKDVYSFVRVK